MIAMFAATYANAGWLLVLALTLLPSLMELRRQARARKGGE